VGDKSKGKSRITIMKIQIIRFAAACVLALALVGCSGSSHYTVVAADAEHQILLGNGKNPPPYEIIPSAGIRLDIGHFEFTEKGATVTPDMVQVTRHARNDRYRLAQPLAGNVILLDLTTLTNVADGSSFPGFASGDQVMVNVGRVKPTALTPDNMTYDWTGLILVK